MLLYVMWHWNANPHKETCYMFFLKVHSAVPTLHIVCVYRNYTLMCFLLYIVIKYENMCLKMISGEFIELPWKSGKGTLVMVQMKMCVFYSWKKNIRKITVSENRKEYISAINICWSHSLHSYLETLSNTYHLFHFLPICNHYNIFTFHSSLV